MSTIGMMYLAANGMLPGDLVFYVIVVVVFVAALIVSCGHDE